MAVIDKLLMSPAREKPRLAAMNEPHLACVLLLDTSGSMAGDSIDSLNKAINQFKEKTMLDELAKKRVDVAIVKFDDTAELVQDFTPISEMQPVHLETGGMTSMCAGIDMAIDLVKERNRLYSSMGTPCFKPWIFMITDGEPTDYSDIPRVAQRIKEESSKGSHGKLKFFALGVPGYSREVLIELTDKVMELEDTDFSGIFNWISESMTTISVSRVGDNVQLPVLPDNARIVPSDWGN